MRRTDLLLLLSVVALSAVFSGCGGEKYYQVGDLRFPQEVGEALAPAREAYEFAARHPEVLGQIPCYCGCRIMGHASNLECFIDEADPDGTVHVDPMGFT